ncbi:MAG: hypothetical protein DSY43_04175 [Gammaproteobacteria bacterium]|nr:MAG: hypothetical protein DSY43_04175 [Gammaproteobacteria bacterium]
MMCFQQDLPLKQKSPAVLLFRNCGVLVFFHLISSDSLANTSIVQLQFLLKNPAPPMHYGSFDVWSVGKVFPDRKF